MSRPPDGSTRQCSDAFEAWGRPSSTSDDGRRGCGRCAPAASGAGGGATDGWPRRDVLRRRVDEVARASCQRWFILMEKTRIAGSGISYAPDPVRQRVGGHALRRRGRVSDPRGDAKHHPNQASSGLEAARGTVTRPLPEHAVGLLDRFADDVQAIHVAACASGSLPSPRTPRRSSPTSDTRCRCNTARTTRLVAPSVTSPGSPSMRTSVSKAVRAARPRERHGGHRRADEAHQVRHRRADERSMGR